MLPSGPECPAPCSVLRAPCSVLRAPSEQRLVDLGRKSRRLLPCELPCSRPALLNQLFALLRIIEPLERVHVVAGIAPLDHHRSSSGDFLEPTGARRHDRQPGRKRLEHGEAEALV